MLAGLQPTREDWRGAEMLVFGTTALCQPRAAGLPIERLWPASLRQGEMQDGLPLRGFRYPDTQKPSLSLFRNS